MWLNRRATWTEGMGYAATTAKSSGAVAYTKIGPTFVGSIFNSRGTMRQQCLGMPSLRSTYRHAAFCRHSLRLGLISAVPDRDPPPKNRASVNWRLRPAWAPSDHEDSGDEEERPTVHWHGKPLRNSPENTGPKRIPWCQKRANLYRLMAVLLAVGQSGGMTYRHDLTNL